MAPIELDEDEYRAKVVLIGLRIRSEAAYAVVDPDTFRNEFNVAGIGHFVKKDKLSPRWERFVAEVWRPRVQKVLAAVDRGKRVALSKNDLAAGRASLSLGPFDWSNERVNYSRAKCFLRTIARLRTNTRGGVIHGRRWWPRDAAGVIRAIKEEKRKENAPYYAPGELQVQAACLREARARGAMF